MRDKILRLLSPFVFAAFQVRVYLSLGFAIDNDVEQYPIFGAAENCFRLSTFNFRSAHIGVHGQYPPPPLPPQDITYFGHIQHKAHVPCVSVFASLSYFSRQETIPVTVPPHLIEASPKTRFEADTLGLSGPTLNDMEHFIHRCLTHFVDYSVSGINIRYSRPPSSIIGKSSYKLGTLTGRWQGSYIVGYHSTLPRYMYSNLVQVPFLDDYQRWLNESQAPSHFPTTGRFPLYVTLQEHFICDPDSVLPWNDTERGTLDAWLPSRLTWVDKSVCATDSACYLSLILIF